MDGLEQPRNGRTAYHFQPAKFWQNGTCVSCDLSCYHRSPHSIWFCGSRSNHLVILVWIPGFGRTRHGSTETKQIPMVCVIPLLSLFFFVLIIVKSIQLCRVIRTCPLYPVSWGWIWILNLDQKANHPFVRSSYLDQMYVSWENAVSSLANDRSFFLFWTGMIDLGLVQD